MNILIVDDEILACTRLQLLVQELYPHAHIWQAHDGLSALNMVNIHHPNIVLLDIRMPIMNGLETAQHIMRLSTPIPVIFTTAYPEHALSAFNANAADYLLKPIRLERLKMALEKASLLSQGRLDEVKAVLHDTESRRTHLSVLIKGDIQLIPIQAIYYLKAEQKYVTVGCRDKEWLINESLKAIEQEFPEQFIRVHRNALVALRYIHGLQKGTDGGYAIQFSDMDTTLGVSRRHLAQVRRCIREI